MDNHPIAPSPELIRHWWLNELPNTHDKSMMNLAVAAARWGADTELEACANWVEDAFMDGWGGHLRAARRPKPPSLKDQALKQLRQIPIDPEAGVSSFELDIIRQALEQLPDE